MQRRVECALVARLGMVAFVVALGLPAILSPAAARATVVVASVETAPPLVAAMPSRAAPDVLEVAEMRVLSLPHGEPDVLAAALIVAEPPPEPVVLGVIAPPVATPPVAAALPEPLTIDGVVVASWYGPGFYGNRTACGQVYTPDIHGVAHRTLPCGTRIRIVSPAGSTLVVAVIDRGPFIAGRSLDLSNATRAALSCSDLCHVRMTVLP